MTTNQTETKAFSAEIGKVLNLMIHSLYTNKDIFLRELISNSSDACDKLRYLSQVDSKFKAPESFAIEISVDKDKRLITIRDNGVGMNKEDLIDNLGTIAKSGTEQFLKQMTGDVKKDSMLIGQFGVGFYSSYMIADYVELTSCKADEDKAYVWSSKGDGMYEIGEASGEVVKGTTITLHIKEGNDEYLDRFRIKHIVKSYSDHIAIPIYYLEDNDTKTQVNSSSALWTRLKSDITEEQYLEFYKNISFGGDTPWLTMHNKNEGAVEFTNLLFIPATRTFDLFHPDRKRRVKLYIKRVFITDENVDIIPHYLRFLRGVIDSEDLPLNISRETLQHSSTVEKIKGAVTKKVLGELKKKIYDARSEYEIFWKNFGAAFKEGLCESLPNGEQLMEVCLFYSYLKDRYITLDEYIADMGSDQKNIYYLSGDNIDKLKASPQIEGFVNKNIDVLLFVDSVDDFWVSANHEYKEKDLKSVTRSKIDLEDENDQVKDEKTSEEIESNEALLSYFKSILKDSVKDVVISKKLSSSPVCLVVDDNALDIRMERFLIEQKQLAKSSAKILEINPKHIIVQKIAQNLNNDSRKELNENLVELLFDQACIIEGEEVKDASGFAKRFSYLIEQIL